MGRREAERVRGRRRRLELNRKRKSVTEISSERQK